MTEQELSKLSKLNSKRENREFMTERECKEYVELAIKLQAEEIKRLRDDLTRATTTLVHAGFKDTGEYLWQAAKAQAVPEGWKLVPIEPTVDQFGGMARDIIQWLRFTESKDQHSESLVKWLKDMGNEIPAWLYKESEINHLSKHVISKGTIAAIIYKTMLAAAPEQNK